MSRRENSGLVPDDDLVAVGKVGKPHGITGCIKVNLYWKESSSMKSGNDLVLVNADDSNDRKLVKILQVRRVGSVPVLRLQDVETRDHAESLRGFEVYVFKRDQDPLEEDEFLLGDLIGMEVVDESGEPVGQVCDVFQTAANEVAVVRGPDGGEVLIPILEDVVVELDVKGRRMVVFRMPGIFD